MRNREWIKKAEHFWSFIYIIRLLGFDTDNVLFSETISFPWINGPSVVDNVFLSNHWQDMMIVGGFLYTAEISYLFTSVRTHTCVSTDTEHINHLIRVTMNEFTSPYFK